jgi:uncharacterized membrane protein
MPLTFLSTGFLLDVASYGLSCAPKLTNSVATALSTTPPATFQGISLLTKASFAAGLVTSLPALTSGMIEFYGLYQVNGLDMSNPKIKKTLYHAGLNDVAIGAAAWSLWKHMKTPSGTPVSGNRALFALSIIVGTGISAYLGGALVYEHGVGVQRQGDGAELKKQELESAKNEVRKNE